MDRVAVFFIAVLSCLWVYSVVERVAHVWRRAKDKSSKRLVHDAFIDGLLLVCLLIALISLWERAIA